LLTRLSALLAANLADWVRIVAHRCWLASGV